MGLHLKIVVLNDLHPRQQPGAAGIAMQYARMLSNDHCVEFWCSRPQGDSGYYEVELPVKSFTYTRLKIRLQRLSKFFQIFYEFFDLKVFFWLLIQAKKTRPDLIWIHQVGNSIPKSVPLFFWLLGIKTIQTHHDYGFFSLGKLYPSDFGLKSSQINSFGKSSNSNSSQFKKLSFAKESTIKNLVFWYRARFLVEISNLNAKNVLLGSQQALINRSFGMKSIVLIPNAAKECSCGNIEERKDDEIRFLFAGRPVGKGLNSISNIVRNTKEGVLFLAGKPDLLHYLPESLSEEKYIYLGDLGQEELFQFMHQVDFVSVLSECFDVFPSILLEAISHSSRVLCSETVGNRFLITCDELGYILPFSESEENLSLDMIKSRFSQIGIRESARATIQNTRTWEIELQHLVATL